MNKNKTIPHSKACFTEKDLNALTRVIQSSMVAHGSLAETLAAHLAEMYGGYGGVSVSSGSIALLIALQCSKIPHGSLIACPTYVCPEVPNAISLSGYSPYFIDTTKDFSIDLQQAKNAAKICNGIILPHLLGIWHDYSQLKEFYPYILEDFAQCLYRPCGKMLPLQGNIGIFSFQGTKPISCGEGGVIIAKSKSELNALIKSQVISKSEYRNNLAPFSDLQAALGLSQLEQLESFSKRRQEIAEFYLSELTGISNIDLPSCQNTSWYRFPLTTKEPITKLIHRFAEYGIAVRRPCSLLSHEFFTNSQGSNNYRGAKKIYDQTFSIPIYPAMNEKQVRQVVKVVKTIFS
ncbi:DegT/DnrJ/EryC1/StrS family aminotransferase [Maridesulfovibrio sp.]|uniref:DegT/DnrJ/EryC1/StrS family aminotransferase n=1 Tax=Maridesulfovibrio sp. TaxID=2795000 RepID=UPI0029C9E93D|nr:DegT/DnrJ/EryC1/StrS family aminotransferase [Maridesulfovibrio sp.]